MEHMGNKVVETMETDDEHTVHLYGWCQEHKALSEDLGQPRGLTIAETHLDSMQHAIIVNKGEIHKYEIKVVIPAGMREYIIILAIPSAVFVARYHASGFDTASNTKMCEQMTRIAGRMGARLQELAGHGSSPELGVPDDTYFALYYPQTSYSVDVNLPEGASYNTKVSNLQNVFRRRSISFDAIFFGPQQAEVTIEVPQIGLISHRLEQSTV